MTSKRIFLLAKLFPHLTAEELEAAVVAMDEKARRDSYEFA